MAKKKTKVVEKDYTDFPHIVKEINILREFCNKMGYTYEEYYFEGYFSERSKPSHLDGTRCYTFEIDNKSDREGNPYSWQWSMITGEEFF